jgi:hypothetical protein
MLGTPILHGDFITIANANGKLCGRGWVCAIFVEQATHENCLRLEVKPLLTFNELPIQFQTETRRKAASGARRLWLDERMIQEIYPDQVLSVFNARFGHPSKRDEGEIVYVSEIVYCSRSSLRPYIRDVDERHMLPFERQRPIEPPIPGMKTFKLFIDLFYDDFGVFSFVYNALGGVYVVLGNLPLSLRQKLRNVNLLGFVPYGVSFADFIRPFVKEMRKLERGVVWDLDGEKVWVVAG